MYEAMDECSVSSVRSEVVYSIGARLSGRTTERLIRTAL